MGLFFIVRMIHFVNASYDQGHTSDRVFKMSEPNILTANEILRCSTLLGSLNDQEVTELAIHSKMVRVARSEVIWNRGDKLDYFAIIGTGFVKMVQSTPTGQELTNEVMGPGNAFGLLGTLDGKGCPLTAKAVCDSVILRVPKAEFLSVYHSNIILMENITSAATRRIRETQDLIKFFATGKVEQRISAILLTLADSYGKSQNGHLVITVPLTRQDISEMTGTTVESTIRTMSRMQKNGIISTEKKYVIVKNLDALKALLSQI
jgi:CRP-like cAMP-binding protein